MKNVIGIFVVSVLPFLLLLTMNSWGDPELPFSMHRSISKKNNINNINNIGGPFVIHGKWMPGKRHNHTCDFTPKAFCRKKDLNLHFQFHDNKLNKIDAVAELRKILKNKKLLLIGDSLMTEFFFGLAELLQVKTKETKYPCRMKFTLHPGNNGTLMHLKACVIVLTGYEGFVKWDKSRVFPEERIRRAIADYDVILFNQGIHYDKLILTCQSALYFNNLGKMLYGKNISKNLNRIYQFCEVTGVLIFWQCLPWVSISG